MMTATDKPATPPAPPAAEAPVAPPAVSPATVDPARRRARSIAIALSLVAMVVMFYVITIVKLGPNVFNRPY
jgi:hypothetical protein